MPWVFKSALTLTRSRGERGPERLLPPHRVGRDGFDSPDFAIGPATGSPAPATGRMA